MESAFFAIGYAIGIAAAELAVAAALIFVLNLVMRTVEGRTRKPLDELIEEGELKKAA